MFSNPKCSKCGREMKFYTWFCGVLFYQCKNKDCEDYCESSKKTRNQVHWQRDDGTIYEPVSKKWIKPEELKTGRL